jgi:hypothetical protein
MIYKFNNTRYCIVSLLLLLLLFGSLSCNNPEIEPFDDEIIFNELAVRQFKKFLNKEIPKIYDEIRIQGYGEASNYNIQYGQNIVGEEEAESILLPLLTESLTFLNAAGFSNTSISGEFGDTESPEIILTALIVLSKFEKEQIDLSDIPNIESNSFMSCLGSASGLTGIFNLATGAAVASRSAILSAVGKFARRSLGWIGAALFIGEFIGCYWGNNSVFK